MLDAVNARVNHGLCVGIDRRRLGMPLRRLGIFLAFTKATSMNPYNQLLRLSREIADKSRELTTHSASEKSATDAVIRSAYERLHNSCDALRGKSRGDGGAPAPFAWFKHD
jgi:hypothetical protein